MRSERRALDAFVANHGGNLPYLSDHCFGGTSGCETLDPTKGTARTGEAHHRITESLSVVRASYLESWVDH